MAASMTVVLAASAACRADPGIRRSRSTPLLGRRSRVRGGGIGMHVVLGPGTGDGRATGDRERPGADDEPERPVQRVRARMGRRSGSVRAAIGTQASPERDADAGEHRRPPERCDDPCERHVGHGGEHGRRRGEVERRAAAADRADRATECSDHHRAVGEFAHLGLPCLVIAGYITQQT
jgi:hypothetical protein